MRSRALKLESADSVRSWVLYILIGLCLVVGLVAWSFHSSGNFNHKYDAWAQLTILTTVVFGYLLKWGWRYKGRAKFWQIYLIAFAAHCAVLAMVFSYGRWHVLPLAIVGSFEIMALATLIALAMGGKL
jgi:hypothetical protein